MQLVVNKTTFFYAAGNLRLNFFSLKESHLLFTTDTVLNAFEMLAN